MNARISLLSFCIALVSITILFSNFDSVNENDSLQNITTTIFIVFALASILTAILSIVRKEGNKVIPTISLTTASLSVYFLLVVLFRETHKEILVESGSSTNYGIFEIPSTNVDSAKTVTLYQLRYLKQNTDSIPAISGLRFGFNYVISGKPAFEYVKISKITRYPDPGLKRNGKYVHSDSITISVRMNDISYSDFRFDYDYELVAGKWEFEFSYKGTKLFSKIFNVYYPDRHL